MPNCRALGFSRSFVKRRRWKHERFIQAEVEAGPVVRALEESLGAGSARARQPLEVLLVYPVGPFKLEYSNLKYHDSLGIFAPRDPSRLDSEVFRLNYSEFRDISLEVLACLDSFSRKEKCPIALRLVAFGSISDRYTPSLWRTYSQAKQLLREHLRTLSTVRAETPVSVSALMLSISTLNTPAEHSFRPFAPAEEKQNWLSVDQVVGQAMRALPWLKPGEYRDEDLFNPYAGFSEARYLPTKETLKRWARDTGLDRAQKGSKLSTDSQQREISK
jgi:hypothetical protein